MGILSSKLNLAPSSRERQRRPSSDSTQRSDRRRLRNRRNNTQGTSSLREGHKRRLQVPYVGQIWRDGRLIFHIVAFPLQGLRSLLLREPRTSEKGMKAHLGCGFPSGVTREFGLSNGSDRLDTEGLDGLQLLGHLFACLLMQDAGFCSRTTSVNTV